MVKNSEQPISAELLISRLLHTLTPANREDWIHELNREDGEPEMDVPESIGKFLGLIEQVGKRQYVKIRNNLNAAFEVGEYPEFTGFVAEYTEFGDITDTFHIVFEELYGKPIKANTLLNHKERLKWRNTLLEELDEMVEQ